MPQFAANLSLMFNEHEFLQRFSAAADAGFKSVEFLFPYEYSEQKLSSLLMRYQLENVLFNFPAGDWAAGERGLAALPGREEEFKQSIALGLKYAFALGTRRLHMMAGIIPQGTDVKQCEEVYVSNLQYAAKQLASYGITLMIEPINQRDMPGYFLSTQEQAHALRKKSDESNVKVQMDFYHAQITEGDIVTTLRQHINEIGHIQIAGVPDRHEPINCELNYPYLFKLLDELGYVGWIGCEYRPRAGTIEGLGWLFGEHAIIPAR